MNGISIFEIAEGCSAAFTDLLHSDPVRQAEGPSFIEQLEEEQVNYRLWIAYSGAFAEYHASLDYRLRESETVRYLVIAQLERIRDALSQILATTLTSKDHKTKSLKS